MYIWSFRDERAAPRGGHQTRILDDLVKAMPETVHAPDSGVRRVRGGIYTHVTAEHRKKGWNGSLPPRPGMWTERRFGADERLTPCAASPSALLLHGPGLAFAQGATSGEDETGESCTRTPPPKGDYGEWHRPRPRPAAARPGCPEPKRPAEREGQGLSGREEGRGGRAAAPEALRKGPSAGMRISRGSGTYYATGKDGNREYLSPAQIDQKVP